jgi:fimbrial chaperone protein
MKPAQRLSRAFATLLAGVLAAAMAPLAASAQAIGVRPVNIELSGGQRATVLNVTNNGSAPTTVQARAFAWAQPNGEDELTATNDIALSPPFAQIPPGQSQTVRLVLRAPKADRETTYRVLLDQVPTPGPNGVVLAVRISIPVFVEPGAPTKYKLNPRVVVGPDGQGELIVSNAGPRRARLSQMHVTLPGKPPITVAGGSVMYVLSGAERRWTLGAIGGLDGAAHAHLTADTDQGALDADAAVASKP